GLVHAGLSRRDEPEQPELRPKRFARHAEASRRRAPMVTMLAEAGEDGGELHLADDLLERAGAVGRRCGVLDDPRGEQLRHDPLATDRSHLAVLEDAEELCLDRGGRFPDLVEKERPAIRFREEAAMRPIGAAECAPDVPEERAFEECFRQRGAVLGEERSASPWAVIVDRAREELLAGSGLALEQHARACLRGALGEKERVLDRGTLSDDAVQAIPF